MRLIDADSFKQLVTVVSIADGHGAGFVNEFCKLIDSQPTAYDLDKVMMDLKDSSAAHAIVGQQYGAVGYVIQEAAEQAISRGIDVAVEIVKRGIVYG